MTGSHILRFAIWLVMPLGMGSMIGATAEAPAGSLALYVAPDGDDANPGTLSRPFASLEQARDTARQRRRSQPGTRVTVRLAGGRYPRTKSFILTAVDSGVTYTAAEGQRALLTGGQPIERSWFEPVRDADVLERIIDVDARNKVWKVNLRAHGITDYGKIQRRGFVGKRYFPDPPAMQLYIGDQRMILARWPNPDEHFPQWLHPYVRERRGVVGRPIKQGIVDSGPTSKEPDFVERGPVFRYAYDRGDRWIQAEDLWLSGVFNHSWEWSYNRVARINPKAKTIALRYGETNGIAPQYSGDFYFAQNLLEEMDRPGEYWLDREAGVLYLIPPPGFFQKNVKIVITMLRQPMIAVQRANDVIIRGMEMAYGRGLAATVNGGERVRFERCTIRDFTDGGLALSGSRHGVSACRLLRNGGTSVALNGGDLLTLESGGCFVEDCQILDSAWHHRVYHPAIQMRGVGQRASHNRIVGHPHVAIHVRGNDQLIEYNEIARVCREFTDMAAIYMYTGYHPTQRGQIVRGNYLHDIGTLPMQNGVYPDNGTMGVRIEGNLFVRIGRAEDRHPGRAVNNNSGAYILTRDNLFVDCAMPYMMSRHSGKKNHDTQRRSWQAFFAKHPLDTLPHVRRYPELRHFWNEERQYPETNVFERNVIWNPSRPMATVFQRGGKNNTKVLNGVVAEYPGILCANNWMADANPGFVDPAHDNFALKRDAEVYRRIPGFRPFEFEKVGPRQSLFRSKP